MAVASTITPDKLAGVITAGNLGSNIPLFDDIEKQSLVLSLGRNIGPLAKYSNELPVLDSLISAGFVDVAGQKPLTDTSTKLLKINAAKIAAIAVVPQEVVEDADIDVFQEVIAKQAPTAFGNVIDSAVLFGTNAPSGWTTLTGGLVSLAETATNRVETTGDLYADIMGKDGVIGKVNADGFRVTGWAGSDTAEADLRTAVDKNGRPLWQPYLDPISGVGTEAIYGKPYVSTLNGAWDDTKALLIGGDWTKLVYGYRKELEYKISSDTSVTIGGKLVSCFENNLVAFRMELAIAVAVLNPITFKNKDNATRFPFAVLTPAAD